MDPSPHVKELPGAVFGASGEQTWDISCDTGNGFLFVICLFVVFFFPFFLRGSQVAQAGLGTHYVVKDDLECLLLLPLTS